MIERRVEISRKVINRSFILELLATHDLTDQKKNLKLEYEMICTHYIKCKYGDYEITILDDWTLNICDERELEFKQVASHYQLELAEFYFSKGIWVIPELEKLKELYPTIYYVVKD